MPNYAIELKWLTVQEAENDEQAIEIAENLEQSLSKQMLYGKHRVAVGDAELVEVSRVDAGILYPPEE